MCWWIGSKTGLDPRPTVFFLRLNPRKLQPATRHEVGVSVMRSPRTNGFVERMNRTLLDEHFRIKGRQKWYETVEEMQADLDEFLHFYNHKRSHQGYQLKGRTPIQALKEALGRKRLPPIIPKEDENAADQAA